MRQIQLIGLVIVRLMTSLIILGVGLALVEIALDALFQHNRISATSEPFYYVLWGLFAVAAWFAAPWLSSALVGTDNSTPTSVLTTNELISIGTFVIGLCVLALHLPAAIRDTVNFVRAEQDDVVAFPITEMLMQWSYIFIGVALLLGTRGVVRLFVWTRRVGSHERDNDTNTD